MNNYKMSDLCANCGREARSHKSGSGACLTVEGRWLIDAGTGRRQWRAPVFSTVNVLTTATWKTHPLACQPCTSAQATVLALAGVEETCGHQFPASERRAASKLVRAGVLLSGRKQGCSMRHYRPAN